MGAKQSKRSVDISGKEAEGAGEVAAAGAGGEGRMEQLADADALKPQLNGDAHIHEQTEKEKELDSGTPENEKDATTEKEGKQQEEEKDVVPVTNGESEQKVENGDTTPTSEDSKKPKKEKVKKKWSLRSISFSRKDKPKQEKKQKEEEPKTNGEPEKVPEETAEVAAEPAAEVTTEESQTASETKSEEKTPETPVTEPITNGSTPPESPKDETPATEEPAASSPEIDRPEPETQTEAEQLPVNGLSLEEVKETPEAEKSEETKPEEPTAETTEIVPETPVKKEVCVDQMPLIEPTPPPLPANPPPSSVASFAATTMAPELTDASLPNTADTAIPTLSANTKDNNVISFMSENGSTDTQIGTAEPSPLSNQINELNLEPMKDLSEQPNNETLGDSVALEDSIPEQELNSKKSENNVTEESVNCEEKTNEEASENVNVIIPSEPDFVVPKQDMDEQSTIYDDVSVPAPENLEVPVPLEELVDVPVPTGTVNNVPVPLENREVPVTPDNLGDSPVPTGNENDLPIPPENLDVSPEHPDMLEHASPPVQNVDISVDSAENKEVSLEEGDLVSDTMEDLPSPPPPICDDGDNDAGKCIKEENIDNINNVDATHEPTEIIITNHIANEGTENDNYEIAVLKNKSKDITCVITDVAVECNGNIDNEKAVKTEETVTEEPPNEIIATNCNESAELKCDGRTATTPADSEAMEMELAAGQANREEPESFPPPPSEPAAAPDMLATPQDLLPASDKIAELIPEVPAIPELKTETLQETTSDVAVAN